MKPKFRKLEVPSEPIEKAVYEERMRIIAAVYAVAEENDWCSEVLRALVAAFPGWTPWEIDLDNTAWETKSDREYYSDPLNAESIVDNWSHELFRDADGRDCMGYDLDGYDRDGFNDSGLDREGYNSRGYNREYVNRQGERDPHAPHWVDAHTTFA